MVFVVITSVLILQCHNGETELDIGGLLNVDCSKVKFPLVNIIQWIQNFTKNLGHLFHMTESYGRLTDHSGCKS